MGEPFLYSAIAANLGPFVDNYVQSMMDIPWILSEVFVGFDFQDAYPSRSGLKRKARIRAERKMELSLQNPQEHEAGFEGEGPFPVEQATKTYRASQPDANFPMLVIGASLISFDICRSAGKPMTSALMPVSTVRLRAMGGSSARIASNLGSIGSMMGVLDPRPAAEVEEDVLTGTMKDLASAQHDVFRGGSKKNVTASSSVPVKFELPEEESMIKGVAYGFILGVSFFLLTSYIKRRFFFASQ